jgi:hypothetical protein
MSWLDRLLPQKNKNASTNATARPLYIPADAPKKAAPKVAEPTSESAELRLLNNSQLATKELDDGTFDPYNTGAFNRSSRWDKISKQKAR